MGVSGCGKSTIGKLLAGRLAWDFLDADDFHPPENITKMTMGISLTDSDRAPWLSVLHETLMPMLTAGRHPILACSALKESYRTVLFQGAIGLQLIYLKGNYELIWSRISRRKGHYMGPGMLKSQFDALEEPVQTQVMDASLSLEEIVERIMSTYQV